VRIKIKSDDKNINLYFPTRLLLNKLTARIAANAINSNSETNNLKLSAKDLEKIFAEINRIKRKYPKLELVNVESASGETVVISL